MPRPNSPARNASPAPLAGLNRQNALSLIAIALWFGYLVIQLTGAWGADLAALYLAGHFHATGQDALVYALSPGVFGETPRAWFPALAALTAQMPAGSAGPAYPYVYPPLWALLIAPLTKVLSLQQFFNLIGLLHAAALTLCLLLARDLITRAHAVCAPNLPARALPPLALTAALLASALLAYPIPTAVYFNQPTALTTALTLLALHRLIRGHPVQAGLCLALAAAIKLTPAAFALLFLLDRSSRALASFALCSLALIAANLLLAPALSQSFLDILPSLSAHTTIARVNSSLLPALYTLGAWLDLLPALPEGPFSPLLGPNGWPIPAALPLIPKLAAILALMLGARALRGMPRAAKLTAAALLIGLITPLFGPLGWQHYYILPLLLLPLLAPSLPRPRAAMALGAVLILGSPSLLLWVPPLARSIPAHQLTLTGLWLATLIAVIALLPRLSTALAGGRLSHEAAARS